MSLPEISNLRLYNHIQKYFMEIYIEIKWEGGDTRDKNDICLEWISKHSAEFRQIWHEYQK